MRTKKFSIIVPVYNCQDYIERCILSILNQKYKNFELIIVNDGSTDNSLEIIKQYVKEDKRIILINKKNEGVSKARNQALEKATGDYICFLDADDYIDDNYIKEICSIIKKYPKIQMINFGFISEVEDMDFNLLSRDEINFKEKYYKDKNSIKKDFIELWDNTMLYNIWNKVYVKRIIEDNKIKFPKSNWGEDVEFNKQYLNVINDMYNSKKCFYHYIRERNGAATKKYKEKLFEIRKNEFKDFNNYFESWNIKKEKYYEFSCRRYIERILGCIENVYCSNMKFKERYNEIKTMINDLTTIEAIKYIKPKSKKIKIMIIPIKLRLTLIAMLMGKIFNSIKTKHPDLFNKLKNRR
jgi:glycosyltransferase EpsJ